MDGEGVLGLRAESPHRDAAPGQSTLRRAVQDAVIAWRTGGDQSLSRRQEGAWSGPVTISNFCCAIIAPTLFAINDIFAFSFHATDPEHNDNSTVIQIRAFKEQRRFYWLEYSEIRDKAERCGGLETSSGTDGAAQEANEHFGLRYRGVVGDFSLVVLPVFVSTVSKVGPFSHSA